MGHILRKIIALEAKLASHDELVDSFFSKHSHYRNYHTVRVQPYDDADRVYVNAEFSIWVYFGYHGAPNEVMVSVFEYPFSAANNIDVDELQSARVDDLTMPLTDSTTVDDVWNWLKPILDKYA